jgi:hypothetical protein
VRRDPEARSGERSPRDRERDHAERLVFVEIDVPEVEHEEERHRHRRRDEGQRVEPGEHSTTTPATTPRSARRNGRMSDRGRCGKIDDTIRGCHQRSCGLAAKPRPPSASGAPQATQ